MADDWAAVADAITTRMEQLGMQQKELADRSKVSPATIRELQRNTRPRRRSPLLLQALSEALRWPSGHLAEVLRGDALDTNPADDYAGLRREVDDLRARVDAIEAQIDR